jgi:hypothetical protein
MRTLRAKSEVGEEVIFTFEILRGKEFFFSRHGRACAEHPRLA